MFGEYTASYCVYTIISVSTRDSTFLPLIIILTWSSLIIEQGSLVYHNLQCHECNTIQLVSPKCNINCYFSNVGSICCLFDAVHFMMRLMTVDNSVYHCSHYHSLVLIQPAISTTVAQGQLSVEIEECFQKLEQTLTSDGINLVGDYISLADAVVWGCLCVILCEKERLLGGT